MDRLDSIQKVRRKLASREPSIGSWIQLAHASLAEIMGASGYDWVAVDLEHGSTSIHQLPEVFRALELGGTLPLARLSEGTHTECKQVLDAGAGGVIVPMVESGEQVAALRDACRWPPAGKRGVAFSRGNLFGKYFDKYSLEAQEPLLVAMIESEPAIENLVSILGVKGLDAVFIGPYDLSASMGITGQFDHKKFQTRISHIVDMCDRYNVASGIHVVNLSDDELDQRIDDGYLFIARSIDSVMLLRTAELPEKYRQKS